MAALVANGYRGPWRWSNLDWELSFYKAWRDWPPLQREPKIFPAFNLGGHRTTSQAREMLWQLKRTSPFANYQTEEFPLEPRGLPVEDYLEIWAEGATPDEWIALAKAFLVEMAEEV